MAQIIGVRFKEVGKVYYFDPCGIQTTVGQHVIVETARGVEYGEVAIANRDVAEGEVTKPLKPVIRIATEEDIEQAAMEHPGLLKTPIVRNGKQATVGYCPEVWAAWE